MRYNSRSLRAKTVTVGVVALAAAALAGLLALFIFANIQFEKDCRDKGGSVATEYHWVNVPAYDAKGQLTGVRPEYQGYLVCNVP